MFLQQNTCINNHTKWIKRQQITSCQFKWGFVIKLIQIKSDLMPRLMKNSFVFWSFLNFGIGRRWWFYTTHLLRCYKDKRPCACHVVNSKTLDITTVCEQVPGYNKRNSSGRLKDLCGLMSLTDSTEDLTVQKARILGWGGSAVFATTYLCDNKCFSLRFQLKNGKNRDNPIHPAGLL